MKANAINFTYPYLQPMQLTTFSACCCSNTNTCTQHDVVMATAAQIQSCYQHITTMIFVLLRWRTGSPRIRSWGTCCDSMALWDHPAQIPSENVAVHDVYENKHVWAKKVLEMLWDTLFVVKCAWSKGRVMKYFPLFLSQCLSGFFKIHTLHLATTTQIIIWKEENIHISYQVNSALIQYFPPQTQLFINLQFSKL